MEASDRSATEVEEGFSHEVGAALQFWGPLSLSLGRLWHPLQEAQVENDVGEDTAKVPMLDAQRFGVIRGVGVVQLPAAGVFDNENRRVAKDLLPGVVADGEESDVVFEAGDILCPDGECGCGKIQVPGDGLWSDAGSGVLPDHQLELNRKPVKCEGRHCFGDAGLMVLCRVQLDMHNVISKGQLWEMERCT